MYGISKGQMPFQSSRQGHNDTRGRAKSMVARLFDRATGETMIAIAGIPCATSMSTGEVARIIQAVEDELESFIPPLAWQA